MKKVGAAELRQNLGTYLRRVEEGERFVVTDRNRPVAELGPAPTLESALDRLISAGRVRQPARRGLVPPLRVSTEPYTLSKALDEIRGGGR